ncbi:TPA: winged helix-turn-helix transcriptional regulator [Kluyvera georgiana]|uniref:ArsR family transcriptional regulator n=1 Tax=Kluyvera georgiana ATCC 51603 TaxID=1354264 RepID=A0A1B7K5C1_9ENTR|nr:metalloregulator ArsR/SmtB family transcription factor [Kluyvera georgiana]MDA8496130.1 metalloregulator ArsR/SmtB family transcription factor [Kluyvera georgiana]OAT55322.1 ArsR family transcriptional regulator [Kluyvera georgiana ATCC 51603]HDG1692676.1 winged helix-turn-helix transcriptional regulator [Kluyvera georgiana]HED1421749.1 winged helix-turn-helix transcriptional regulator [Kluyvera georgiana]
MNEIDFLQARASEAATLLKAMSNPHRLLILCMLCDAPGTSAGDLAKVTGLSPSATSQHLARMREEGLIDSQRAAQRLHYFIKNDAVRQIVATLKTLFCP